MMNTNEQKKNKAFTLIEMSMVLAILGLIFAIIAVGEGVVEQAKIRGVINELNFFRSAAMAFKMQYNYFPGDFGQASTLWGTNCAATPANCNGDQNGLIYYAEGCSISNNENCEGLRAWNHLNLSGIYPNTLTGIGNGTGIEGDYDGDATANLPRSKYYPGGYTLQFFYVPASFYPLDNGVATTALNSVTINFVAIGASVADYYPNAPLFSVKEAFSIDTKMDDGYITTGLILGWGGSFWYDAGNCGGSSGDVALTTYNFSTTGEQCSLYYSINDYSPNY